MRITPRSAWTSYVPNWSSPARGVGFGRLHHEGGGKRGVPADKAACLRQIESYVLNLGYIAIDYNLMVFQDGDVWEGRGLSHEDAATADHNTDSVSVCAVGNFDIEPAPAAMVNACGHAFREASNQGWLAAHATIYGHRDSYPTACPGNNLYAQLAAVRQAYAGTGGAPTPKPPEEDEVEHGMFVDVAVNPDDPASGYVLDRWGGLHNFGKAPDTKAPAYWSQQDVARRLVVTDFGKPAGYVFDLNGGVHPFGGAATGPGVPYWDGGKIVKFNET